MSTQIKFTTSPESYSIEINISKNVCAEFLLPAFEKLEHIKYPFQLMKEELFAFKALLEIALRELTLNYKSEIGNGETVTLFGKNYLLTLLNKEHRSIASLLAIYEMVEDCMMKRNVVCVELVSD